jgi:hypothetical protein
LICVRFSPARCQLSYSQSRARVSSSFTTVACTRQHIPKQITCNSDAHQPAAPLQSCWQRTPASLTTLHTFRFANFDFHCDFHTASVVTSITGPSVCVLTAQTRSKSVNTSMISLQRLCWSCESCGRGHTGSVHQDAADVRVSRVVVATLRVYIKMLLMFQSRVCNH